MSPWRCLFTALCATPLCAQPRAVLADGSGPWSNAQWAFTVSQFSGLLSDAGYTREDRFAGGPACRARQPEYPGRGSLTGESAFRMLHGHRRACKQRRQPDGEWRRAVPQPALSHARRPLARLGRLPSSSRIASAAGTLHSPVDPHDISRPKSSTLPTSGVRVPVARSRGLFSSSFSSGRYRVIGDLLLPAATLYDNTTSPFPRRCPFPRHTRSSCGCPGRKSPIPSARNSSPLSKQRPTVSISLPPVRIRSCGCRARRSPAAPTILNAARVSRASQPAVVDFRTVRRHRAARRRLEPHRRRTAQRPTPYREPPERRLHAQLPPHDRKSGGGSRR